ncbi:radical SAM domain-containing protein [Salinisphaera sp. PC39]|uniref:7-carboxy-7-deazaguanine synthase QueE n=1 Tax=Salinisphaera sp. PC39 TaxID=1304156 RepID=UPI00333EA7F8
MTADARVAPAARRRRTGGADSLRITEIFYSLQGEARDAGYPTVFVRLTGCPLRCRYCDTAYAFTGGERLTLDDILSRVAAHGVPHVCVTGGEPLAQPGCADLVRRLCDAGHIVSVETSGALDIRPIDRRASRVVDLKTPGSGEVDRNRWDNLAALTDNDQIKFVICDRADFDWACARVREHDLTARCPVWFSPSHETLPPATLAEWLMAEALPVRLQLQLHKLLWGDEPGR